MKIHRVRGNDLRDALQRARRSYGEGALVISHETEADGGVTLAVARRTPTRPEDLRVPKPLRPPAVEVTAETPKEPKVWPSGFQAVSKRLEATGCSDSWIERIIHQAAKRVGPDEHPMDTAGRFVGEQFHIARAPKTRGVTRVIAFVGNTGVGKTTGLVKLGARLVRGRRRVAMATLDTRRVGSVEQYRAYAELLGAPLEALTSETNLTAESIGARGQDVVLLDTSGRAEYDLPQLISLQQALAGGDGSCQLDTFLVFPAVASRDALREVTEHFGDLPFAGCVVTKLDETSRPAPVLEHVAELDLPIAFLSDGQDIGRNFHRATPELLADLLLLGRIG
jgi:flagellar biosynthesis GTPase FlhF